MPRRFTRTRRHEHIHAEPLHALEPRRLFAAFALGGTNLTLTGDAVTANAITFDYDGQRRVYTAAVNGKTELFAADRVKTLVVNGGAAADRITVGTGVTLSTHLYAGGGNDTIVGGAGNDTADGGPGTDAFNGNGGSDTSVNVETNTNVENATTPSTGGNTTGTGTGGTGTTGSGTAGGGTPTLPVNAKAVSPTPVITAMTTALHVGQALFVHGLASKLGVGTADTGHFVWDFGDGSAAYNTLVGFNAGHVYDKAGVYTVTLKLWNQDDGFKQTSIRVNVAEAARTTYYVSAAGSDSNKGTSASSPVKTYGKAAALVAARKDNVEVLFRDGDTFSVTSTLHVNGDNVRVGSYGSGGKPVLRWDGPLTTQDMVRVESASTGAVIQGVTFDSKYAGPNGSRGGMPFAIHVLGDRLAVRDVTFVNLGYDINANTAPNGLLVQNSDSPTTYGLHDYFVWAQGTDFVLLGNKVANSTNEHPIRVYGVDRMLLAYNDLKNPRTYSFETSKTALNIQKGSDIYVWHNTIRGPRWQVGPLGGKDGIDDKSARLNDVVIENNTIFDTQIEVDHGVNNVYLRNNVFDYSNINALSVEGYDSTYKRGVSNLNVVNNTFVNAGDHGRLLYVDGDVSGITLVNNLYKADAMVVGANATAAVYVNDTSLHSFTKISNNVWPVPTLTDYFQKHVPGGNAFAFVGTVANDTGSYYNISRWDALGVVGTDSQTKLSLNGAYKPTTQTGVVSTALTNFPGVFGDYAGNARSLTGTWTVGAVQL